MIALDRRQTLLLGAASLLAGSGANAAAPGGLDAIARTRGLRFGTAVGIGNGAFDDPRYRALMERDCGVLVSENELKWQQLEPRQGQVEFGPADRIVAYAEQHGMQMRGHNLVWHHPKWLPHWLGSARFHADPRTGMERLVSGHIRAVCRRYRSRIHSWDVVNEAVDNETGVMRETVISKAIGSSEAVLDLAFHTARDVMPDAQLVYNDYMSWEPGPGLHRAGVLRLLEGFRKRGTPVDALGLQSHIGSGNGGGSTGAAFGPHDAKAWRDFLDRVTAMGFKLLITEFDVNDGALAGDIPTRDREIAAYARDYLDLTLSYPQLDTMMVWGLCDRYSWLQHRGGGGEARAERPCPYDADYRPKPLRDAIAASLAAAPTR